MNNPKSLTNFNQVSTLKTAIQEGIDSGIAKDFDPKKHLKSLKSKKEITP